MTIGRSVSLLIALFTLIHTLSTVHTSRNQGRKLFGGYRIVPRACRPSIKIHKNTDGPSICMFNYECSQRNGQVVGACMDGFLFGACCLLPPNSNVDKLNFTLNEGSNDETLTNIHELDHVPDIPILLNPDGTPIESSMSETSIKTVPPNYINFEKIPTFTPNKNSTYNKDKSDLTNVEQQYPILIGEQQILDDLRLPSLLSHSDSHNDLQEQPDTVAVNPIATILSPDQIFQIADPVDQLPALFSHGFGQNNYTMADTILLNENGTALNETYNPDDLFKPSTVKMETTKIQSTHGTTDQRNKPPSTDSTRIPTNTSTNQMTSTTSFSSSSLDFKPTFTKSKHKFTNDTPTTAAHSISSDVYQKIPTIEEKVSFHDIDASAVGNEAAPTTPMTPTDTDREDDLIRVPTINNEIKTGNKKSDILDKEEIAINHIISILNGTTPGLDGSATAQGPSSSIHTWISIDEPSKPTKSSTHRPTTNNQFDYTFYKPNKGSSSIYKTPSSTTEKYSYTFYKPIKPSTQSNNPSHSTSNTYSSRPPTLVTHGSSSSLFSTSPSPSSPTPTISSSTANNFGYSSRPTTNPPAPTVIVLGPLGTEFTSETTQKTRNPTTSTTSIPTKIIKPNTSSTKKPSVSTTITHNISTIISTGNNVNKNNHLIQTSYITVNLKDGTTSKPFIDTTNSLPSTEASVTAIKDSNQQNNKKPLIYTTISSWSDKPIFNLKPSDDQISISEELGKPVSTSTTEVQSYEDDTSAPNNVILDEGSMSFPPVRNPNLNTSVPLLQQEKPTIVETFNDTGYPDIDLISENEIPTPGFVEDDVLNNKVDEFVEKIVQSLHLNFQDLKDIVNNSNNVTSSTTPTPTKRPLTTKKPVRKPSTAKPATSKPAGSRPATSKPVTPTRKPNPTRKPQSSSTSRPKPTSSKPKPSGSTTQKPPQTSSNRPTKPIRNDFTTSQTTTSQLLETSSSSIIQTPSTTIGPDFRKHCGIRPLIRNGRIVGGKASQFGKWPWQVLVREATWLGLFTKNKCGGVLITEKYVMTAAHCQPGFLASLVAVFGEFDISGELESKRSMSRNVRRVIVYRGYNAVTFENDLALLELESPVQFDEHIVPICMPPDGSDFTGKMATVTGWGRLKYSGGVPSVLQEVKVPVMENSVCQEMFQTAGHSKYILDSFLCAGYANGQKDSCEGDSGGPLVIQGSDGRWILVGTVSHGIKCAAPYLPGVYMRTTYFKPWLHSITGV